MQSIHRAPQGFDLVFKTSLLNHSLGNKLFKMDFQKHYSVTLSVNIFLNKNFRNLFMHQVLDFPGGPVVGDSIHAFTAGAPDSVHGWETRIPQAVQ